MVSNLCPWIKRHPWRFTGMDMKYVRSYLNWRVHLFRVKRTNERWPEIAKVARHLLMTDAHFLSLT